MLSSKKALILAVLSVLPIQIYECNLVKLLGEPDQISHQGPSPDNFPSSLHCCTKHEWHQHMEQPDKINNCLHWHFINTCLVMNALIKIAYPDFHGYFSIGNASFYSFRSMQCISLFRCILFLTSSFYFQVMLVCFKLLVQLH